MSGSLQPEGLLQARLLAWVAVPSFKRSFQLRVQTQVSHIADRFFPSWAPREAQVRSKPTKEKKQQWLNTWGHGAADMTLHAYRKTLEIIWLTCHLSLHWLKIPVSVLIPSYVSTQYQIPTQKTQQLFRVNLLKTNAFDEEKSHLLISSSSYSYLPVFFFVGLKCS